MKRKGRVFTSNRLILPLVKYFAERANMLRHYSKKVITTWPKLVVKAQDGTDKVLRLLDLTKDLVDEFVEFEIKHFVKNERFHQMSGIPYSAKALNEYKNIIKNYHVNPFYHTILCCPEVEGTLLPKIVASCTIKLLQKNDKHYDIYEKAKTDEVKKFIHINHELDNLSSVNAVMEKYGVEHVLDFYSVAVDPAYARAGIANKIIHLGAKMLSEAYNINVCFAWMTSEGTLKIGAKNGWLTELEIKPEEITNKFNAKLENLPYIFKFMVLKL